MMVSHAFSHHSNGILFQNMFTACSDLHLHRAVAREGPRVDHANDQSISRPELSSSGRKRERSAEFPHFRLPRPSKLLSLPLLGHRKYLIGGAGLVRRGPQPPKRRLGHPPRPSIEARSTTAPVVKPRTDTALSNECIGSDGRTARNRFSRVQSANLRLPSDTVAGRGALWRFSARPGTRKPTQRRP